MASNSGFVSTTLSKFQVLVTQIGVEISTFEVKLIKCLVIERLPKQVLDEINFREQYAALDVFCALQEYRHISENNLELFKQILTIAGRNDLIKKVEAFEADVVELKNAPQSQMALLPAPEYVFLYLLVDGHHRSLTVQRINGMKEAICCALGLNQMAVTYLTAEENAADHASTFITFQFPKVEEQINKLNLAATNRDAWLVDLGVLLLEVHGRSTVYIKEGGQFRPSEPKPETSMLEMKPSVEGHHRDVLDVILIFELPQVVGVYNCKTMLEQCQLAINSVNQNGNLDMRLFMIRFGDHSSDQAQEIAFVVQGDLTSFDIMARMRNERQCGGRHGTSGISDALTKVVNLVEGQKLRPEASKVCILISFLRNESDNLEHYRCCHGGDVIQLCHSLASFAITVNIVGIETGKRLEEKRMENSCLPGFAAIGGGHYVPLQNVCNLMEVMKCIITHDLSIENQGGAFGRAVINGINKRFGTVNVKHLARDLVHDGALQRIDNIKHEGTSLPPLSQISERISWANDLDDAIESVSSMASFSHEERTENQKRRTFMAPSSLKQSKMEWLGDEPCSGSTSKDSILFPPEKTPICSYTSAPDEAIDVEVATRIVRRQLPRMAYYKNPESSD